MHGFAVKIAGKLSFLLCGLCSTLTIILLLFLLVNQFDDRYKFVLYLADFILILIQKKHIMEAVRFICIFKLIDKLLPIPQLKESVEDEKKCFQVLCRIRIALDEKVFSFLNIQFLLPK